MSHTWFFHFVYHECHLVCGRIAEVASTLFTLNQMRNMFSKIIRPCQLNYFQNQSFGSAISKYFLFSFNIICEITLLSEEAFRNKFFKDRNKENRKVFKTKKLPSITYKKDGKRWFSNLDLIESNGRQQNHPFQIKLCQLKESL